MSNEDSISGPHHKMLHKSSYRINNHLSSFGKIKSMSATNKVEHESEYPWRLHNHHRDTIGFSFLRNSRVSKVLPSSQKTYSNCLACMTLKIFSRADCELLVRYKRRCWKVIILMTITHNTVGKWFVFIPYSPRIGCIIKQVKTREGVQVKLNWCIWKSLRHANGLLFPMALWGTHLFPVLAKDTWHEAFWLKTHFT